MAGTLFVVATPIGNLSDLSPRAAETLRRVEVIAAEDTRETRKLADLAGSRARLVSVNAHATEGRLGEVLGLLEAGSDVAFCSDAGTPGVSDPGPALVSAARERGIPVLPIPGPSAVATALAVSGWSADRYLFLGFAPRKGQEREAWLERIRDSEIPVVCFEAANRTAGLVTDLARVAGPDRGVMMGREMTKRFEEYPRDTAAALALALERSPLKGEVTLVVAGSNQVTAPRADPGGVASLVTALVAAGMERSRIAKVVTEVHGLSRNDAYRAAMGEA